MATYLQHYGVLGMRWGIRRSNDALNGISESTISLAKKDAKRHADAKMFYGETAGTRRKLLKADINKKKSMIPDYEKAFDHHLANVDMAKSARKAVSERTRIDTVRKGRSLVKQILGVTGSLTVGIATMAYYANKQRVDSFVMNNVANIISKLR